MTASYRNAFAPLPTWKRLLWLSVVVSIGACVRAGSQPAPVPTSAAITPQASEEIRIALVGTSDLHGYVAGQPLVVRDRAGQKRAIRRGGLALFGGYLENLRARMPVLLLDGGDMFQGTLVSNLGEGRAVVDAYNLLGYQAAAIGNHEFDYGPVGPRAVPSSDGSDDPNGALKARAAEARFPFLSANLLDKRTHKPVTWPNVYPSTRVEVAGIPIGVIGAVTEDTPMTTNILNLRDVTISKIVPAVRAEAAALRATGVAAVILTIHEGADCLSFDNPHDLSACQNSNERILSLVRALDGAVDAVVAGHTHAGVAHFVGDVPIVQAFLYGYSFGRIDLTFRRQGTGPWRIDRSRSQIYPPIEMCEVELPTLVPPAAQPARSQLDRCNPRVLDGTDLRPAIYEGRPVTASSAVDALLRPHIERATARADTPLGVTVAGRVQRSVREESALAQLMADLIRSGASRVQGQPVDLAVQNGGGMRNDLPAGPLTYGHVFEVQPFDSRLAIRRLSGAQLAEVFRRNLGSVHGVLVPSGIRVEVQCEGGQPRVTLRRESGEPLDLARVYSVAMSDFLASGGDDFASIAPEQATPPASVTPVTYYDDMLLRDLIVEELSRYHGPLLSGQMQPPRIVLPSPRPLRCASQ